MTNAEIAKLFDHLADLLEIKGETVFRIRAYRNAVRTLEGLTEPVADIIDDPDRELESLSGIGKELAKKIQVIVETGQLPQLEKLREEIPVGVQQMLRIPGLGPKKVSALFSKLDVETLDDLKAAAEAGRVAELKGFGKKTQETILEHIEDAKQASQRFSIAVGRKNAERIRDDLLNVESVSRAEVAGSTRRRSETVGDLDVLAIADDSSEAMDALADHELVTDVLARGETKMRVRLVDGIELDLRVVPEESFGAALQYFTGSKEHNVAVRQIAQKKQLKLSEYGLFDGEQRVAGATEEEVYDALGMVWVPPELRENRGEIERAQQDTLPVLLTREDIKGDLHMHTTASDGKATIAQMIEGAIERGLEYIAITDHSKRVSMANGLDAKRLRKHFDEIRSVAEEYPDFVVLTGVECDILEDGSLDLDDEVLAEADWVLGVLHYGLQQPGEQIMKRLRTALESEHIDAIGHPTGRYVLRRRGAEIDWSEFLDLAKETGTALEINANPARLDLDDRHAAAAKERGIPIVINTDAHSVAGLDVMPFGVDQARRAGLEKGDVLNTLSAEEFKQTIGTGR